MLVGGLQLSASRCSVLPLGVSRSICRAATRHALWRCRHPAVTVPSSVHDSRKQRGRLALVDVRHRATLLQRQTGLRAVLRVDLTLFVTRHSTRACSGGGHVRITMSRAFDELRIARHLQTAHDVRLQILGTVIPPRCWQRRNSATSLRVLSAAAAGFALGGQLDQLRHEMHLDRRRPRRVALNATSTQPAGTARASSHLPR